VLNEKRNTGITVYGAIGAAMERPLFKQFKTTNKEDFLSFISGIRETLSEQDRNKKSSSFLTITSRMAH
jgi:hypothetical protein